MNNIYNGNQADSGAVVHLIGGSRFEGYNSLFIQNIADDDGGAFYIDSGSILLHNSIMSNNSAVNNINIGGDTTFVSISYTISDEMWPGVGNQNATPLFVDIDGIDNIPGNDDDDFYLQIGSPGINRGDTLMMYLDLFDRNSNGDSSELFPYDLDENPRIYGDSIDIGAFEFQGPNSVPDGFQFLPTAYPNPTNGDLTIDLGKVLNQVDVRIINLLGQEITSVQSVSGHQVKINFAGASGIYIVNLTTEVGASTFRVMKR